MPSENENKLIGTFLGMTSSSYEYVANIIARNTVEATGLAASLAAGVATSKALAAAWSTPAFLAFSASEEPATLFGGGTWVREHNGGDGNFYKEEGDGDTGGQTRTHGLQPDQLFKHRHKRQRLRKRV